MEFLRSSDSIEAAVRKAPRNWDRMNIQFVLETTVINNNQGLPKVVAAAFWEAAIR